MTTRMPIDSNANTGAYPVVVVSRSPYRQALSTDVAILPIIEEGKDWNPDILYSEGDLESIDKQSVRAQEALSVEAVEEGSTKWPDVFIQPSHDEAMAMIMLVKALNIPTGLSMFLQLLPKIIILSMFFAPAWPEPAQLVFGLYPFAIMLGEHFAKPYKNPWLIYHVFLSPLILATAVRLAPIIGRIILCRVILNPVIHDKIENTSEKVLTFVSNDCKVYNKHWQKISKRQWVLVGVEIVVSLYLAWRLYISWRDAREAVDRPLQRYYRRMVYSANFRGMKV